MQPRLQSVDAIPLLLGNEVLWHVARPRADLFFARGGPLGPVHRGPRLAAALAVLGPTMRAARWGDQVHGRVIASIASESGAPLTGAMSVGRCDGLVSADPEVGLAVWTADCVPLLIDGGEAVMAVHAGWRGIAAGIVQRAVRRLEVEYGIPASEQRAVLGPAIGADHYPVGREVVEALGRSGVPREDWCGPGGLVDLRALVGAILTAAGMPRPTTVGGCTACDPELASFRRDRERAGRQWSMIVRRRD